VGAPEPTQAPRQWKEPRTLERRKLRPQGPDSERASATPEELATANQTESSS
jgi:hypothetical protein